WPVQVLLMLLALVALFVAYRPRPSSTKLVFVILGFFWLWMGIAYHIMFFAAINPAANFFGAFFILQGALFMFAAWAKSSPGFRFTADVHGLAGALLVLYALVVYPILGFLEGRVYMQSPTFGAPCPTTIFTFGLLLWAAGKVPAYLLIVPFLWSLLGSSAALSLGIGEDVGLFIAGIGATALILLRNRKRAAQPKVAEPAA
ncbi:MAG TPA: DUF6064 family protein, partial [Bacteroidota bacterium]